MDLSLLTPIPVGDELDAIRSCIFQFIAQNHTKVAQQSPMVITVWDAETANRCIRSNTAPGDYCVLMRPVDSYRDPENINRIHKLWNDGLYPIELLREGVGLFGAFKRDEVLHNLVKSAELVFYEDDEMDN